MQHPSASLTPASARQESHSLTHFKLFTRRPEPRADGTLGWRHPQQLYASGSGSSSSQNSYRWKGVLQGCRLHAADAKLIDCIEEPALGGRPSRSARTLPAAATACTQALPAQLPE